LLTWNLWLNNVFTVSFLEILFYDSSIYCFTSLCEVWPLTTSSINKDLGREFFRRFRMAWDFCIYFSINKFFSEKLNTSYLHSLSIAREGVHFVNIFMFFSKNGLFIFAFVFEGLDYWRELSFFSCLLLGSQSVFYITWLHS